MASLSQIATGIATQLDTITGLSVTPYVPDGVNAPAAFLRLIDMSEDVFNGEGYSLTFDAIILVSSSVAKAGQGFLYDYASMTGNRSVWLAIQANKDLDLTDGTEARVIRYRSLGIEEVGAYGYFGGAFEIRVTTQ